jgi:hypothetical protein
LFMRSGHIDVEGVFSWYNHCLCRMSLTVLVHHGTARCQHPDFVVATAPPGDLAGAMRRLEWGPGSAWGALCHRLGHRRASKCVT